MGGKRSRRTDENGGDEEIGAAEHGRVVRHAQLLGHLGEQGHERVAVVVEEVVGDVLAAGVVGPVGSLEVVLARDVAVGRLEIVRAGGAEAASAYLDKAQARNNTAKMGSWHPFNYIDTPDQAQTRVPALAGNKGGVGSEEDDGHLHGYDTDYGIGGDGCIHNTSMINIARYVAVAPRDPATDVRGLPFIGS